MPPEDVGAQFVARNLAASFLFNSQNPFRRDRLVGFEPRLHRAARALDGGC